MGRTVLIFSSVWNSISCKHTDNLSVALLVYVWLLWQLWCQLDACYAACLLAAAGRPDSSAASSFHVLQLVLRVISVWRWYRVREQTDRFSQVSFKCWQCGEWNIKNGNCIFYFSFIKDIFSEVIFNQCSIWKAALIRRCPPSVWEGKDITARPGSLRWR